MRITRSVKRLVAVVTSTVALVSVLNVPAFAHDQYHNVTLSGSIFIKDDDLWPNPDDTGTHIFSGSVRVGREIFSQTFETSGCVGGEVLGELTVIVEDQSNGWVKARARGRLFESESCPNSDMDGDSGERVVWVPSGGERSLEFRVHNGEPGDFGYNDYKLTIRNLPA